MTHPTPLHKLAFAALLPAIAALAAAQTLPVQPTPGLPIPNPANDPFPGIPLVGPVTTTPEIHDLLQMLHDRKSTLKDLAANIDYSVEDPRGGITGKRGTVAYIMDPILGPIFSADFTTNTRDARPVLLNHAQFIFDGKDLTAKDWGPDGKSKTFVRVTMLQPGDKPGDAVTLRGALTLPIGLDVDDVLKTFVVSQQPSKDTNVGILRLVPRPGTHFNYKQLDITVDRKNQLPVTIAQTALDDSLTTITLTELNINPGNAAMLDSSTPAADGWNPKGGAPSGAGAGPATAP